MTPTEAQLLLRDFAQARDWGQFHTPKNLVMALTGEAGELADLFQWLTPEESWSRFQPSAAGRARLEEEMADVYSYLLRLADVLEVDLEAALRTKIAANERRYPIEKVRGRATKYTELEGS